MTSNFDVPDVVLTSVIHDAGRLTVALGHVGLVMLVCRSGLWSWLTTSLAAVGRTALSNYVSQTWICTLIFNGYGLGLYGRPERWHAVLLVIAIWCVQLIVSSYWLVYFRYGPLEWIWRSLTYLKPQRIVVRRDQQPASARSE